MLRKTAPYLIFLGLGVLFVFSQPLAYDFLYWIAVHARGLDTFATDAAASPAEVWADAQLSGWPSVGRATGKLIMAAGFFVLSSILPWLMQKLTHPAPARWKASGYSAEFDALPAEQKFTVSGGVDARATWRIVGSIIAAAVIN